MPLAATMKRRHQSNRDAYGEALWITDYWSNEYFHWITDALPRLLVARDFVAGRDLLLPNRFRELKFLEPSLKPFGVDRIAYIPPRQGVRCERLLMPTSTAPTGNYNEGLVRNMRELFVRHFEDSSNRDSPVSSDKVYISRRRAGRRRVANEDEISSVLQEFGFVVVCMEDFAFERQVRILACAKYLVSNHGAGLTNMLFMPPGGRVLELRRVGDSHNNCFFALASALDLEYFYQLCPSGRHRLNPRSRDLIVDAPALRRTLTAMLDRGNIG
jgi:capsular polysaccharide biosynthesis protein